MRPEGERAPSAAIQAAGLRLQVDAVTAEIVTRLREARVRAIVLKGPAIAAWLYADGSPRPYVDTDLLVSQGALPDAERVLLAAGFRRGGPGWQEVSRSWVREGGGVVDLHTSLFAVGAGPARLWRELSAGTELLCVSGVEVEVPSRAALAFHVALHAAQHGSERGTALCDLERALASADEDCWREAAALAERLDALPAFATGLRLSPAGIRMTDRFGLTGERSTLATLHAHGAQPLVLGLEHLAAGAGAGSRLRFLARKIAPSPADMRANSALARRGLAGLALAYGLRAVWIALRLPAAVRAWRLARRQASAARAPR